MRVCRIAAVRLIVAVGVCTGCLSSVTGCAGTGQPGRRQLRTNHDIFGEAPPALDARKAHLKLADIQPAPSPPDQGPARTPQHSERAQRALARAEELRAARRYTEATIELEKALRYDPGSAAVHRAMAWTQWESGSGERASSHIEQALAMGDDDVVSHYLLGRLAAARFENAQAIRHFRKSLLCSTDDATRPVRSLAQYHLAEALAAEGYLSAAVDLYKRFQREHEVPASDAPASPGPAGTIPITSQDVDERIAWACEQLQQYDLAVEHLRSAYLGREMDAETRRDFAKLLARAGRLDDALSEARILLRTELSAIDVLSRIYERLGTPEAIVSDLRQLCIERPTDIGSALALADALDHFGHDDEAVRLLEDRISQHPDLVELVWKLFDLLAEHKRWHDALATAADAIRRKAEWTPDAVERVKKLVADEEAAQVLLGDQTGLPTDDVDFVTAYLQGVIAQAGNRTDSATACFEASISRQPDFMPARVDLGKIYLGRYDWARLLETVDPAGLDLPPDTRIEWLLGEACVGLDQLEEAAGHYRTAIRLNPANTAAMSALAELYVISGEGNRAMRQIEELIKVDPFNERAREQLFLAYLADRDPRAAAEQLAELRRIAATPTCIARCVARLELNPASPNYARLFRQTLQDAMDSYHPDAETLRMIAESYLRERRPGEAVKVLERALKLEPGNTPAAEALVTSYWHNLEFEKVLEQLQTLLKRYPNRAAWKSSVLRVLLVLQRFDEAIEVVSSRLAEKGLDEETADILRSTLIHIHQVRKDFPSAIEVLERWREDNRDNVFLLTQLIATCQDAGRGQRVPELIRQWRDEISGGLAVGVAESIWAGLTPDQYDEVIEIVLEAVENDPDNDALQIRLIEVLRAVGRHEEAIDLAKDNVATARHDPLFNEEIRLTLEASGRTDEALKIIDQMLMDTASSSPQASLALLPLRVRMVELLIKAGRYRKALERINRWLEDADSEQQSIDERLVYLQLLASCHQEAGNPSEAAESLSLAAELDPNNVGLCNDLGYTLADLGRDIERAEELVRVAVASEPENSAYLDSLGWVLYKKGEFGTAKLWLTRARNAGDGEDPVLCDHLGDTCWRLGDRQEALHRWEEAARFASQRLDDDPQRVADHATLVSATAKLTAAADGREPDIAPTAEAKQLP